MDTSLLKVLIGKKGPFNALCNSYIKANTILSSQLIEGMKFEATFEQVFSILVIGF